MVTDHKSRVHSVAVELVVLLTKHYCANLVQALFLATPRLLLLLLLLAWLHLLSSYWLDRWCRTEAQYSVGDSSYRDNHIESEILISLLLFHPGIRLTRSRNGAILGITVSVILKWKTENRKWITKIGSLIWLGIQPHLLLSTTDRCVWQFF